MPKATETKTAEVVKNEAVSALIGKAGKAAASMLAYCKAAAEAAAPQLDPALSFPDRIAAVVSAYAEDFKTAGHNVRALFVDALTLHAAGAEPVTVQQGKGTIHTTAAEATKASKHVMRAAAKEVRDAHGIGRRAGGGRKAAAPKAQAAEAAVGAAPDVKTETDVFSQWLDALPDYLQDAVFHPRIVAALIDAGYTLSKAAKGRKVTGAATA
jgi:hypothetical protein